MIYGYLLPVGYFTYATWIWVAKPNYYQVRIDSDQSWGQSYSSEQSERDGVAQRLQEWIRRVRPVDD